MTSRSKQDAALTLAGLALTWQRKGHDYFTKQDFHREGKKALKAVAAALGLAKGEFDLRSNLAGDAVSGEVTLHTEHWYVQLSAEWPGHEVLFRLCNGRKDYTGFKNCYRPAGTLATPEAFAVVLVGLLSDGLARTGGFKAPFSITPEAEARFQAVKRLAAAS